MADDNIYYSADLRIISQGAQHNKPYIEIKVPAGANNQHVFYLSLNIAEMIGGAARGARLRWEDQQRAQRMSSSD